MISKITANIEAGKRILVHADFFIETEKKDEEGKAIMEKIHEITTAFPLETPSEEIEAEVEKAGKLFESEQAQAEKQKKIDKIFDKANKTVNKLNNK